MPSILLFCFLTFVLAVKSSDIPVSEEHQALRAQVHRAEIQSCRGCALNRLPEVKAFIYEDVGKYNNIEFKPIPGANPDLVLFTKNNQELDRIDLSRKSRRECNDLLLHWGFSLKRHQNLHPDENEAFKVEL
ncbi:unnamed protein product [Bemisia tabaci]|uniref:Selenoprotein M n=1 Tax=Bemisia tabaci TaxID=7038 RepID=A0A9P0EVS9_BEMTA|nr:PREDICTED: selenoprotein M-like [Bemisia tabaci]CAH0380829.1 unnamed protein product [Bemisia tabaci]